MVITVYKRAGVILRTSAITVVVRFSDEGAKEGAAIK